jgi:hypothetical protein
MKLQDIQKQVIDAFYQQFKNYEGGLNLSRPHIPLISEGYLKNRVIVMGQETNTWYRKGEDDLKDYYLGHYDPSNTNYGSEPYKEFVKNSAEKYSGAFWRFSRKLYLNNVLEGNLQNDGFLSHCWINLFTTEAVNEKNEIDGRPTKNLILRNEVLSLEKGLHLKLFEILKPEMLILLTGLFLTTDLINSTFQLDFNELEYPTIDNNEVFGSHELCELKINSPSHPLFSSKIVRAYHPTFFLGGRINKVKKLQLRAEKVGLQIGINQHYNDTLQGWIKLNLKF